MVCLNIRITICDISNFLEGHGFAQSRKNKCLKKYRKMIKKSSGKDIDYRDQRNTHKTKRRRLNDLSSTRKQYQLEKEAKEQRIKVS